MQGLGVKEYHRSCTDNLHEGLKELGLTAPEVPSPVNLWMNIPWTEDPRPCGSLDFVAPVSKPGDYIVMRAEMDCIVAFSACPQVISQHQSPHVAPCTRVAARAFFTGLRAAAALKKVGKHGEMCCAILRIGGREEMP